MKFKQFAIQKEKIKSSLSIGFDDEKILFYFIDDGETENILKICRSGFDRSVIEQTGRNYCSSTLFLLYIFKRKFL